MWTEYFTFMTMAVLLRLSYELSKPTDGNPDSAPANSTMLSPRQKEWAAKAVQRYAESQDRKWQRWNEAMFEPQRD